MTEKVGKNIMSLAKRIAVCDAIVGVITFIVLWSTVEVLWGFIVLLLAIGIGVSCWPLYGFGMLIDDVHAMRKGSAAATPAVEEAADELPDL